MLWAFALLGAQGFSLRWEGLSTRGPGANACSLYGLDPYGTCPAEAERPPKRAYSGTTLGV
jgi:hypothetical protein